MSDDHLTSALEEERAILAAAADAADQGAWRIAAEIYGTLKVSSLVAALEAVLEKVGEWEAEAEDTRWQITPEDRGAAHLGRDHAESLREAITAALTGTPENSSAQTAATREDEGHGAGQ